MEVQVIDTQEIGADLKPESLEEISRLAEELGLSRQAEKAQEPTAAFRPMTAEEFAVFHMIVPVREKIGDYYKTVIPLRILEVFKKVRADFDEVQVWSPEHAEEKDPVLVGIKRSRTVVGAFTSVSEGIYYLARWGEVLLPFSELAAKALAMWKAQLRKKLQEFKDYVDPTLSRLDGMTLEDMVERRADLPAFYR